MRAPPARSRVFGRTLLTALRPRFTVHWRRRNQRAEASPEPRLRVPSAGRPRSARPRRPVSPSRPSTERPSAPASRGRPPAPLEMLRRRASAGSAKAASGDSFSRTLQSVRSSWRSRTKQLRNGARTVTADNILSTRVQRKARGSSVAARAPGRLAEREKEHPRRPRTSPAEDARLPGVASSPSRRGRGNPPGRGAGRALGAEQEAYLVDPASSICLSQRLSHACLSTNGLYSETAKGSLNQLWFL